MDSKYGEVYRELFERHWWWRSRTELIVGKLRELQPVEGWNSILDIGCGDGLFFDRLAEFGEVEGVEPSGGTNPHRGRIYRCPFDSNFKPAKLYRLVLMLDVLEHIEYPAAALAQAISLMTPGGTLVATLPAFMSLWTSHDVLNQHFVRYTKTSFGKVAQQAGLEIYEQRYLYQWMFPAKLCMSLVERVLPPEAKPPSIPSNWLNGTLYWLSRVEQSVLSHLPVPFGSSLMVIGGRKSQATVATRSEEISRSLTSSEQ